MYRIPSQPPASAARLRAPLPGLNQIAAQINRTQPMDKLRSILNMATSSVSAVQTTLPQGQIDFQEVSESSDEGSQPSCASNEQLEAGEISAPDLESTRAVLAMLEDVHAQLPEGDERSHYQAQIARLQSALRSQRQATPTAVVLMDVTASNASQAKVAFTSPVVDLPADRQPVRGEQPPVIVAAAQLTMTSALAKLSRHAFQRVLVRSRPFATPTSNETALLPGNVPTFKALGQGDAMQVGGNSLRETLFRWGSAQVQSLNVMLENQAALKEKANRTPQPPPYTKLERVCLVNSPNPVKQLLKASRINTQLKDANPNAGSYGALHCAVVANNGTALRTLLASSAGKIDVDMVSDAHGATALDMAIERQFWHRVEELMGANAKPTCRTFELLALNGNVERFKQLHEHWQALTRTYADWHALTRREVGTRPHQDRIDFQSTLGVAVGVNALAIAHYLFAQGVRPGEQGYLMLQLAAYNGHEEMLGLLLRHVPRDLAHLRSDSNVEESPLVLAMQGGHVKAVAVLLEERTDPQFVTAVTESFETATPRLSIADRQRLAPVTTLLRNWLQEQRRTASKTALAPALLLDPHGEAANDSGAADLLKHSGKVPTSYAFSRPPGL